MHPIENFIKYLDKTFSFAHGLSYFTNDMSTVLHNEDITFPAGDEATADTEAMDAIMTQIVDFFSFMCSQTPIRLSQCS